MPDRDGLEVCRELRRRSDVAIIAVTARGEERDRVNGLRTGADDYVDKPFGVAELHARIDAVMRRAARSATPGAMFRLRALSVDLGAHRVEVDGQEVALTRKEFALPAALIRSPGRCTGPTPFVAGTSSQDQNMAPGRFQRLAV